MVKECPNSIASPNLMLAEVTAASLVCDWKPQQQGLPFAISGALHLSKEDIGSTILLKILHVG